MAADWTRFRGPNGQGISAEKNLPTKWSATDNVAWKTAIDVEGWSSPIVCGDQVFISGTTNEGVSCHVIAFDRKTGEVLWNIKVFDQVTRHKRSENSYATPTPTTDGKRVYAVFGSGSIAAVDFSGKLAWVNHDVKFYSHHGLSSSPLIVDGLLVMPFDGSSDGADNDGADNKVGWKIPWQDAVLLALDTETGKAKWRGKRGLSRLSHGSPCLMEVNGKTQIISGAGDVVQGHDPANGEFDGFFLDDCFDVFLLAAVFAASRFATVSFRLKEFPIFPLTRKRRSGRGGAEGQFTDVLAGDHPALRLGGFIVNRANKQKQAVAWVRENGGTAYYGFEWHDETGTVISGADAPGPVGFHSGLPESASLRESIVID